MPGVLDSSNGDKSNTEMVTEQPQQQQQPAEEQPTRESTQTDRLNHALLRSYLDHINAQDVARRAETSNQNGTNGDSNNGQDSDW